MDYSPPGSSVHGIFLARILEWVAMPYSRGSSDTGIKPTSLGSAALAGGFFTAEPPGKPNTPRTEVKSPDCQIPPLLLYLPSQHLSSHLIKNTISLPLFTQNSFGKFTQNPLGLLTQNPGSSFRKQNFCDTDQRHLEGKGMKILVARAAFLSPSDEGLQL